MGRNVRHLAGLVLVLAGMGLSSSVNAEGPAQSTRATVVVAQGQRFEGRLVEATPGKMVILELPGGKVRSWKWEEVKELVVEGPGTATASPVMTAPPNASAAPGVSSGAEPAANSESESDCSEHDERCREERKARLGKEGLGLSYSKESVRRVKKPPTGAVNGSLGLNFYGASGDNLSMVGGGGSLSVRGMTGGKFPGPSGGSWFGFYGEPMLSMNGVATTVTVPAMCVYSYCTQETKDTSGAGLLLVQVGAGLQWMTFGRMDRRSLVQSGFGLAVGGTVGYQKTLAKEASGGAASYGPQFTLLFPRYNAGTAKYSSINANLFILPTKDMVMFIAGLQFMF